MEERYGPYQILMGAKDKKVCVVLGLTLFLEKWIAARVGPSSQWLVLDGTTDTMSVLELQNKDFER